MRIAEKPFDEKPELVVWDFNGLMLDDLTFGYGCMEFIFQLFCLQAPGKHVVRNELGSDVMPFYWNHHIPRSQGIELISGIRTVYYLQRLSQIQVHFRPGLEKILEQCRAGGVKLAICSGECESIFHPLINAAGIRGFFGVAIRLGVGGNKAEALQKICKHANISADRAVYVDDMADGITHAREAGLKSIGFANATSWNTAARIEQANPDRVAHDLKDVPGILGI